MKTYSYISDPGHGWVEVEFKELKRLGIEREVSPFSYTNETKVYLEEDCDLSLFIQAKKALGEDYKLVDVYQENTPIRSYHRYGGSL